MLRIGILVVAALGFHVVNAEITPEPTTQNLTEERSAFHSAYRDSLDLTKKKDFHNAAIAAQRALHLGKQSGSSAEELANLEFNLGFLLVQAKQYGAACDVLDDSIDSLAKVHGKKSVRLVTPLQELGGCLSMDINTRSKSLKAYKRATRISAATYGDESSEHALSLFIMGQAMIQRLGNRTGNKHLQAALDIFEKVNGADSPEVLAARFNLAKYALAMKKHDEAIEHLNEILEQSENSDEPASRLELSVHGFLIEAYEKTNQSEEATKHCLAIGRMTPEREIQDYIPLFKPQPNYPRSALMAGKQGETIVEFAVDEFGFVQDPKVIDRKGSIAFDKPSLEVAKRFRYAPAFVDGKAVKTEGIRNRIVYAIAR